MPGYIRRFPNMQTIQILIGITGRDGGNHKPDYQSSPSRANNRAGVP
jgi:hypothetical protein